MMFRVSALLLGVLLFTGFCLADDRLEISEVLFNFEQGIQKADGELLKSLFIHENALMYGVRDGQIPVSFDPSRNSPAGFAEFVTSSEISLKETLSNYELMIEGGIATAKCRYKFFRDGKMTNHGSDIFTLVKTDDGWKIVSLVWTVIMVE